MAVDTIQPRPWDRQAYNTYLVERIDAEAEESYRQALAPLLEEHMADAPATRAPLSKRCLSNDQIDEHAVPAGKRPRADAGQPVGMEE